MDRMARGGHGIIENNAPGFLPEKFKLLPQKLKDLGYATHMVGKWHLGFCNLRYTPTYRGFDTFMGYYGGAEDYYTHTLGGVINFLFYSVFFLSFVYTKVVITSVLPIFKSIEITYAKRAVEIINNHDPQKQPLFLYLPFQSVHSPLQVEFTRSSIMVPTEYSDKYTTILDQNRKTYSVTILNFCIQNTFIIYSTNIDFTS
ncbi:hypothetical protein KUTeg_024491 [Tegillarca granosa]|uniref:Sulfatase N-terminal domain-containing protein n=1 Tax=Tegillarca granosa TaxID=220873 RepID=A0ABQ9E358_TEGGR|nr:hypothetical protein KUTeg_024491 [Tegillarca granosa]